MTDLVGRRTVAVIGAGLMGHGIAQVFAAGGHPVRVYDPSAEALETLSGRIRANLAVLGQDPSAVERVVACEDLPSAVAPADIVVEAAAENLLVKQRLFHEIEAQVRDDTVLATNTSVIPVSAIMSGLRRPERALGTHWWNPPFLVPLVEVVAGERTSPAVVDDAIDLLTSLGKTCVRVRKDVPGFVGNRLQHALWREAIALVRDGVCDAETVDTVVKAGFGRRLAVLGPLENADLVGTDLTLAIHETILPALNRDEAPSAHLRALVAAGKLGIKSGEGFRTWSPASSAELRRALTAHLVAAAVDHAGHGSVAWAAPKLQGADPTGF